MKYCYGGFKMKNKIKEFREALGYTQDELAQKTEVSRQTIISLEKGKCNPSINLAFKLSIIFHSSIEEIFMYEGN